MATDAVPEPVHDLDTLLATLTVSRRPGTYAVVRLDEAPAIRDGVEAVIVEAEGITAVVADEVAARAGWPVAFRGAWLTLDVHSALDAVGLTAAFSAALAAADIPCNVLAGYHHDHLLVPTDRADDAIAAIERLAHR